MTKNIISTDKAPAAIGPYSQAIEVNGLIYTSGVIPIDPATGNLVEGDIKVQADQAIGNLAALLKEAGSDTDNVIKTVVFINISTTLCRETPHFIAFCYISHLTCRGR